MHLEGLLSEIEGAVRSQLAMASGDPAVETAGTMVLSALRPALTQAAFSLAEQAALEVAAQLPAHSVVVQLVDGDPVLKVTDTGDGESSTTVDEDLSARITLRLPPSVKSMVEEAAGGSGSSVNQWVVEALNRGARSKGRGRSESGTIDL